MTVVFLSGPHGQRFHRESERERVRSALTSCAETRSLARLVNVLFNRPEHFSLNASNGRVRCVTDPHAFLARVQELARSDSPAENVYVMGTPHCDAFAHTSQLVTQRDDSGVSHPCLMRDEYVQLRFSQAEAEAETKEKEEEEEEEDEEAPDATTYHFLTDYPRLIACPMDAARFPPRYVSAEKA